MKEYDLNTTDFSPSWPPIFLIISFGLIFFAGQYSDKLFIGIPIISLSFFFSIFTIVFILKFRKIMHKAKIILNDDHISIYSYWKKRYFNVPISLIDNVLYVKRREVIKYKIGYAPYDYFELVMKLKNSSKNYWKNWSLTLPFILDFKKYCEENKIPFDDKSGTLKNV